MCLAEIERGEAAVIFRLFLFDDVGLYRYAEMVGLAGVVGGVVLVHAIFFEGAVAQIAPQDADHAEVMGVAEGLGDFLNLAV